MTGSVGYSRTQLITRYTNSDADMLTSSARTTSGHACAKCASGFRPCAWQRSNAALIDIRHRLCAQTATMHASANLPTARPVRPASPLRNPEGRATGKTPPTPSALLPFRPRGQRCPVGRIPYTVHMPFCAVCRNRPQRPVQAIMPLLSFPRSEKWREESSFLSGGKISPNSASLTTDEKGGTADVFLYIILRHRIAQRGAVLVRGEPGELLGPAPAAEPAHPLVERPHEVGKAPLRPVGRVEELALERSEEALHPGVVRAAPLARHAPREPELLAYRDPAGPSVVPAPVAVHRRRLARPERRAGGFEGGVGQLRAANRFAFCCISLLSFG